MRFPFIRFRTANPSHRPRRGEIHLFFDAVSEVFKFRKSDGTDTEIGSGGNAVLTRTAAEGDPNFTGAQVANGLLGSEGEALVFPLMIGDLATGLTASSGGKNYYLGGGPGAWQLNVTTGLTLNCEWTSASDATDPALVTDWNAAEGFGTGTPIITTTQFESTATHHRQMCVVGTVNPLIFQALNSADLTEWTLIGPAGVVADNENPGSFRRIIFDGGAISSETYTPAD